MEPTTSLMILIGVVCAFFGWVAGVLIQHHYDCKQLDRILFKERKEGWAEGYTRAMGKGHNEIKE